MNNMPVSAKHLKWFPGMRTFLCATIALWAIVGIVAFVAGHMRHRPELFWFPLFSRTAIFNDFEIYQDQFRWFGKPQFWTFPHPYSYPAPDALFFKAFFAVPKNPLLFFRGFIVFSFLVAASWSARALIRRGLDRRSAVLFVGVTLISSYPFMFLLQRANMEVVNWIFVSLAIAAFWCERWKLAGALLGVAISLKLFPFVLLGLFLGRRKFAAILIAIATAAALDLTVLALLGPTIKIANQNLAAAMQGFGNGYVVAYHYWEIPFDHSLLAIIKHLGHHMRIDDSARFTRIAHGYMMFAAIGGLLLYFARIVRLPRVNQIVILLALSLLLPPVSGDYTLVHLYPAWLALALFALQAEPGVIRSRVLPACFLLLAIVFCPETYMFIGQAHVAGSFKALALCALIILLLVFRLEEKRPTQAGELDEYSDVQAGSFRPAPAISELP
jgi:hypothetical protein